jgi:hypothetical protein
MGFVHWIDVMLVFNQRQTKAENPFVQLFDSLNRSRGETTSSFFLKKISNTEKIIIRVLDLSSRI